MMYILIYAIIIYMGVNIYKMNKRTKKSQKIIAAVKNVENEQEFYAQVDDIIENINDVEFQNKARVLKLWGMAYHKHYQGFNECLESIELGALMNQTTKGLSIEKNEDSFFYLYLAIPNLLHFADRDDLRKKIVEKMDEVKDMLEPQLVRNISVAIDSFYENTGDKGLSFYQSILDGDYGDYTYAKSLIGMYKAIVNAHAARIYLDEDNMESFETTIPFLKEFAETNLGERWLKTLDLKKYVEEAKKEEENSDQEEFVIRDNEESK